MPISLVCALSLLLAALALGALAVRNESLLVMRWPKVGFLCFEWQEGRRYRLIPAVAVPLAVGRFAVRMACQAPAAALRAAYRLGSRIPYPISGKA